MTARLVAALLLAATLPAQAASVRVATLQFESLNGDFDNNLQRVKPLLREVSRQGAQLVLLPELALAGYELSPRLWNSAEPSHGRTVEALLALAEELNLYIGTSFLEVEGEHFFNTFVLATPSSSIAGRVRKQVPAGAEGYFFRGAVNDHFIDTPLGRLGVGICQENYRCFLPAHLHENDVDLLLMPYSYPDLSESGGLASPPGSYTATWYAEQLGIPVVTSNKTGPWPQVEGAYFPGRSAIVAADGTVVSELSGAPGATVARVDLDDSQKRAPDADCVGPYLSDLTLGSWFERRLTWAAVMLSQLFDADPDAEIARTYAQNEARRAAALRQSAPEAAAGQH